MRRIWQGSAPGSFRLQLRIDGSHVVFTMTVADADVVMRRMEAAGGGPLREYAVAQYWDGQLFQLTEAAEATRWVRRNATRLRRTAERMIQVVQARQARKQDLKLDAAPDGIDISPLDVRGRTTVTLSREAISRLGFRLGFYWKAAGGATIAFDPFGELWQAQPQEAFAAFSKAQFDQVRRWLFELVASTIPRAVVAHELRSAFWRADLILKRAVQLTGSGETGLMGEIYVRAQEKLRTAMKLGVWTQLDQKVLLNHLRLVSLRLISLEPALAAKLNDTIAIIQESDASFESGDLTLDGVG